MEFQTKGRGHRSATVTKVIANPGNKFGAKVTYESNKSHRERIRTERRRAKESYSKWTLTSSNLQTNVVLASSSSPRSRVGSAIVNETNLNIDREGVTSTWSSESEARGGSVQTERSSESAQSAL